jgi:hypothetical protein
MNRAIDAEVLIVGAGPVGLTLAMDLAWRGVDVTIAELRRTGEPPSVKCNSISARSMEIFRRLGLAAKLRGAGLPADYPNDVVSRTTATGIELCRIGSCASIITMPRAGCASCCAESATPASAISTRIRACCGGPPTMPSSGSGCGRRASPSGWCPRPNRASGERTATVRRRMRRPARPARRNRSSLARVGWRESPRAHARPWPARTGVKRPQGRAVRSRDLARSHRAIAIHPVAANRWASRSGA